MKNVVNTDETRGLFNCSFTLLKYLIIVHKRWIQIKKAKIPQTAFKVRDKSFNRLPRPNNPKTSPDVTRGAFWSLMIYNLSYVIFFTNYIMIAIAN